MRVTRRALITGAIAACAYLPAAAQEWPNRPLTMVIPTAAGGGADILGRILAARLAEILGQPVVIENVGNAVAATNRIAKGVPDGYHFNLGGTAHLAFHPTIYKTPVYNARTDFAPVALVVEQPFLLVTRTDFRPTICRSSSLTPRRTRASCNTALAPGPAPETTCPAKCSMPRSG